MSPTSNVGLENLVSRICWIRRSRPDMIIKSLGVGVALLTTLTGRVSAATQPGNTQWLALSHTLLQPGGDPAQALTLIQEGLKAHEANRP